MAKVKIRLKNDLPRLRGNYYRNTARIVDRYAAEIVALARIFVPVQTGRLRDSIRADRVSRLRIDVSANTPYASHVENGTLRRPPKPYLAPAVILVAPRYWAEMTLIERLMR